MRKMSDDERCPFVLWVGAKRLIKRKNWMNIQSECIRSRKLLFLGKHYLKRWRMFGSMEEHKQASFCNAERSYYGRTSE